MYEDRRRTFDELAEMTGLSWSVLKRLRNSVRQKRPDLWATGEWFLHQNNALAHSAIVVRQFLTKNGMITVSHPPYSPDMAPCDFFLFPRMKKNMKGKRFEDIDEVIRKTRAELKGITSEEFSDCFKKWKTRLDKCIASEGEYFEGA